MTYTWHRHFKIICKTMDKAHCPLTQDQMDILAGCLASLYVQNLQYEVMDGVRVVKRDESHG